jgi:ribosomal protein S27AE
MMDDRGLSGFQRLFRRLASPELFAAMERDSRLWKAECPNCRTDTTSIWEMGGIRYKAVGEPRKRARCPRCGQLRWLRIHWAGGDRTALGPRPSVMPLILKIAVYTMLIPLVLIGGIVAILVALLG